MYTIDSQNIQVILRVRPSNNNENLDETGRCISVIDDQTVLLKNPPNDRLYNFDYVTESDSQEDFFGRIAKGLASFCIDGFNCCVFAYGQTGSGKTHTMTGEIKAEISNQTGIQLRLLQYLFTLMFTQKMEQKVEFQVGCSYFEIYNENILDLLQTNSLNLKVRQDIKKGTYVEHLSELQIENWTEGVEIIQRGQKNRKTASTLMNAQSSRSHSVFQVAMHSKSYHNGLNVIKSTKLNFVDLAGSERQKSSGAQDDRLKEANFINKSLLQLGTVISQLVNLNDSNTNKITHHISYRNSKLTHLLQDCLGGNSKTLMIAAISPSSIQYYETLSTLKFAQNVKQVKNQAKVNEKVNCYEIKRLKEEIVLLKEQIHNRQLSSIVEMVPSVKSYQMPLNVEILQRLKEKLQDLTSMTDNICQCFTSSQSVSKINESVESIQEIILSLISTVEKYSRNKPQNKDLLPKQLISKISVQNIPKVQIMEVHNTISNECFGCQCLAQNIINQRDELEIQLKDMKAFFNMQISLLKQENKVLIQEHKVLFQQAQDEITTLNEFQQFNQNDLVSQQFTLQQELGNISQGLSKQVQLTYQANQMRDTALQDIYQLKKLIDKQKKQLEELQVITVQRDLNQLILNNLRDELRTYWDKIVIQQTKLPWQLEAFKQSEQPQPIFRQLNHLIKICLNSKYVDILRDEK